jgi:glycerol-3-phosphate dehydrogenase (NAD(P)+)
VVLAVPSHALRESLEDWRELHPGTAIFVSLIKGIELDTRKRASQIIREVLDAPYSHVVVVSGPNLARECARRMPGATVAAGPESSSSSASRR